MLKVAKPSSNRLDIELSGKLDADTMNIALDGLIEKADGLNHGKMLYTISDFEIPTMGALAVEFQHMPKLFGLMGRFDKCAVLSDTSWIRTAAEIEGAVIPSLEIKSFPLTERNAAENWLEGASDEADDDEENFPV
jgi:hypothetical protein